MGSYTDAEIRLIAERCADDAHNALSDVRPVTAADISMLTEYALESFAEYDFWDENEVSRAEAIIEHTIKNLIG